MKRTLKAALAIVTMLALAVMFSDTAAAQQKGNGTPKGQGQYFVDKDGDGICDNVGTHQGQKMGNAGKGYGKKDGTGNQGVGPKDGTGYGAGKCGGTCDGTGPKGSANRGSARGK